jgi:hypothetical protein
MFDKFKSTLGLCPFRINEDNTIRNTDCRVEPIMLASECKARPDKCFDMKENSNYYGKTKVPLKFYKQTLVDKIETQSFRNNIKKSQHLHALTIYYGR